MTNYVKLPERVKEAEKLARKNGGRLPRLKDIRSTHPGLVRQIDIHPEAFAHIPRAFVRHSKVRKTCEEIVAAIKQIAKDNGGVLPKRVDLVKINASYSSYVERHPELFADVPRATHSKETRKRIDKAIRQLEKLAARTSGEFVISQRFQANLPALTMTIRRYPDEFAHITRVRRETKTLAEHIADANRLAAAGKSGELPSVAELKRNHGALYSTMCRFPEVFSEFKKQRQRIDDPEAYVKIARQVAKQNGGAVPGWTWLKANRQLGLYHAMRRYPEMFKDFKRIDRNGKIVPAPNL